MKKISVGQSLTKAMQGDNALSERNWNTSVVAEPVRPMGEPDKLDDAITALLIMAGATCKLVHNRYVLTNKKGKRSAVALGGSFEDWRLALENMLPSRFDR
jgi:hypothetical protein